MTSLLQRPFVIALLAGLAVLAAAAALPLLHLARGGDAPAVTSPTTGQPWQLQRDGERIAVFGLRLPGSTLADAERRWGDGLQLALMAGRGEGAALEAYVERYDSGGVGGKLLLAIALPGDELARLRANAAHGEPVSADTMRYTLATADRATLATAPLAGISFVPAADLDAATLQQRFGTPAERWRQGDRLEHWLYPERGLAIVLDAQGRELLQYVAPADFERRLRAPLLQNGATLLK